MQNTVTQQLAAVAAGKDREALRPVLNALADRLSSQSLATAGLVITATSGKKVPKVGAAAYYGIANGRLVTKAAATDMPALSGTVTNAKFNVFCFYIDSAGTLTSAMGTEGATLAAVKFPQTPEGKAIVGFIVINPTGTGNFVGDTTALDDGTVVPNTAYISPVGAFDPRVALS